MTIGENNPSVIQASQAVEAELKNVVSQIISPMADELHNMLAYHMGWRGEGAGPQAQGKRVRPLLLLLTTAAAGGDWRCALPAAASVELIHNFSLIHDDIQDNSPIRRGRPTVWKKWAIPQAINAGDTMFALANVAMLNLASSTTPIVALQATNLLQRTYLHLTRGQFLDISYEARMIITLDEYWSMIGGKTAALLSACTELGAMLANAEDTTRTAYREFGHNLGLAFQVQDDLIGIWGDSALSGKSAESDLVAGKKSFPVLYGLTQNGPFAKQWQKGPIQIDEVESLAAQLEAEGARDYTQKTVARLTAVALQAIEQANPGGEAGEALVALANQLLRRQG